MHKALEPWQLKQLMRLAYHSPSRVTSALNLLWEAQPDFYAELAIAAVDQEQLSVDACSETLGISVEEVEARLVSFRQTSQPPTAEVAPTMAVVQGESALARCPESGLAVWEIVRKYRKEGSWDRLVQAFPSVSMKELAMALEYAEHHHDEIDQAIQHYEQMLQRRKSLYPFARQG